MTASKFKIAALVVATAMAVAAPAMAASGEQMFNDNCSACHQKTGLGIKGAFPALKADKFVMGDPNLVAMTVLNGRGGMPAFKDSLSDFELSQILTYVRSAWGNKAKPISSADFTKARKGVVPPKARLQIH